jgi:hypothetical protein
MCASTRQKKRKSASPTPKSKKQKSASPTPTSNTELLNDWHKHRDGLTTEEKALIDRETAAARAAGGSRLAAARHLLVVRRFLVGDATNPKQMKLWSAYLAANLPGFSISRAQVFKDISAAKAAEELFPATFLNVFIDSGYALNVRPTAEAPLGKFTEPSKHRLSHLMGDELGEQECLEVLADVADAIKAEAKRNRPTPTPQSADEKRSRILKAIHEAVIDGIEDLAKAIEPGEEYSAMRLRDDLETIVCRVLKATGIDALELEPKALPEDFKSLSLPVPAPKPPKKHRPSKGALAKAATAA